MNIIIRHIKFTLYIIMCTAANIYGGSFLSVLGSLSELLLIFGISSVISGKSKIWGYLANAFMCIIFSVQCLILFFSGEFLSPLMIENAGMADNLGDNITTYSILTAAVVAVSFLPFRITEGISSTKAYKLVVSISAMVYCATLFTGILANGHAVSPIASLSETSFKMARKRVFPLNYRNADRKDIMEFFHRDSISTGFRDCSTLAKMPNIIVIFTEGLSAEVLDSYNNLGLNLTPNIESLRSESLSFENYFNHTAATFRGIRGQLYSGYQYRGGYGSHSNKGFAEIDHNSIRDKTEVEINSITDILEGNGYNTCFINPEPEHSATVNYIKTLGFNNVFPSEGNRKLSDKEAFSELERCIASSREPYFVGFYNIGTHHGFDSPDEKFGNGKNPILNRWKNYDTQFGKWFRRMKDKGVFENTLLIFTTDHASYNSPEWKSTFKSSQDSFIARIPLLIYGAGIKPGCIDASGRNSLDLAPTLLDILGLDKTPNWFLGSSLFSKPETIYDRFCAIGDDFFRITDNHAISIRNKYRSIISEIKKYYLISLNE